MLETFFVWYSFIGISLTILYCLALISSHKGFDLVKRDAERSNISVALLITTILAMVCFLWPVTVYLILKKVFRYV